MTLLTCITLASLVASSMAIMTGNVTKCTSGTANLVGDTKVFTVQVCNLFGGTCYMNHVETAPANCATEALMLENQMCALFPIMTYQNHARTDASKLQVGGSGCSVSCTGTDCKFSGACVSVQCSLGGSPATYAGPAMTKTGSSSSRTTGVTDTSTATFEVNTFASIQGVSGSKTVLLSRTGNYVGTYARGGSASGTNTYTYGKLPTIAGNNYGPKACPSATQLVSAATGITKEELRMCGSTGKWVYFGAANLLMDKGMNAKYSGDSASGLATTKLVLGNNVAFLNGDSAYRSGDAMDDSRAVYLYDGAPVLMTSGTITPAKSTGMVAQDTAGQWRFYTVVFYCDLYARTDLTTCPEANRKMFYVADPNSAPSYGTTAAMSGGGSTTGALSSPSIKPKVTCSLLAALAFLIFVVV